MAHALLLAIRPKTLPAALAPVWVGCVFSWFRHGLLDIPLAVATVASAMFIQIASNLFNDAIDARKGADTTARFGPQRVTASGLMSASAVLALAGGALVLACLAAWPLLAARGWPIVWIGLPSLYFSFGYTGGPWPLAYRGLGECFVMLFFGLVAVTGTVFVQTGQWDPLAILPGIQVGALSTALIAINNLRDIAEDQRTGKRTLAARHGIRWARNEVTLLLLAPFAAGLLWWVAGYPLLALGPLPALPLALATAAGIRREEPGPGHNRLLARAGASLLLFAVGFQLAAIPCAR